MAIYKTKRRIMDDDGVYHVVYEETTTDQVKHTDGTTAEDHIDSTIASTDSTHGLRYDPESRTLECFNPATESWEGIGIESISEIVRFLMNGMTGNFAVGLFTRNSVGLMTDTGVQIFANKDF